MELAELRMKKFKVQTVLFVLSIIFYIGYIIMSYKNAEWQSVHSIYVYKQSMAITPFSRLLKITGIFLLFITFLLSMFRQKIICSKKMFYALVFMFSLSIVWLVEGLRNYSFMTMLVNLNNPPLILWYIIIGFLLGTDDRCWHTLKKLVPFIAFVFTILSLISAIQFNNTYAGARMEESSLMTYFIMGFWATVCWILIVNKKKRWSNLFKWLILSLLIAVALITNSRSWLIQCTLVLLYYIISAYKKRKISTLFFHLLVLSIIIIVGEILIQGYFNTAYVNLVARADADTRSEQIFTFFSQVPLSELIFGQGVNAKYIFGGQLYGFIDNQIIFLCFRYGMIPTLIYLLILVSGIFSCAKEYKGAKYFLFLWLMALMGLSVYFNIDMDIPNLIALMIMGRLYKTNRMNRAKIASYENSQKIL